MAMCEPFPEGLFEEQEAFRLPATPPQSRQRAETTFEEGNRLQQRNEIRRHSTSAATSVKEGAFHTAANKLREAKQKLKEKLTGAHRERQITEEELARAAQKRDELKEKEREAERRASNAADDYDRLVSKQLQQKCHEADYEANKMHSDHHVHSRAMEIHL